MHRRQFAAGLSAIATLGLAAWPDIASAQGAPVNEANAPPLPAVGSLLQVPEVTRFDGRVQSPKQAEGNVLLVYWWASWCPFCAEQSPHMERLWQRYKADGLQMLALSVDRKAEDAVNYLKKKGFTFPAGLVTPAIARTMPKPKGLPVTLVRGRDGRVLQAEKGQLFPEDVEQLARWL